MLRHTWRSSELSALALIAASCGAVMFRADRNNYSNSKPVIKPKDLNGASHAVLTLETVDEVTFDEGPKIVMTFEEFPDYNYFPNVTSLDQVIARLGEETEDWKGQRIPFQVVKTTNVKTKKPTDALWIAPAEEWDTHLRGGGRGRSARKAPARASAKKKTGSRSSR